MIGHAMALKFATLGKRVIGLDIETPSDLKRDGVQTIKADITQADLLNDIISSYGVTSILHAGGISGPMLHKNDPYKVFLINSFGTLNIVEAARRYGIERLVFSLHLSPTVNRKIQVLSMRAECNVGLMPTQRVKFPPKIFYGVIAKFIN